MSRKITGLMALAVLVGGLAGCGKDAAEPAVAAQEAPAPAAASADPAMAPSPAAASAMPHGFVVPFTTTVVRDQVVEVGEGASQRRIHLNAAGVKAADAEAKLGEAFVAAGFKPGKVLERDGSRSINYRKDGKVVVVVGIKPDGANGSDVRFGWNL